MKNTFTTTMILAAAAMTLGLTTATAQSTNQFKAEIPFPFQVGNEKFEAGTYAAHISSTTGGARILFIGDPEAKNRRVAVSTGTLNPATGGGKQDATMVFRCGDSGCNLVQVWPGRGSAGSLFSAPTGSSAGPQRMAVFHLQILHAD